MINPRLGCYAVYEPAEEGWENLEVQFKQVTESLRQAGMEVVVAPEAVRDVASCERVAAWFANQALDLLHALVITWSFDHYTVMIQQAVQVPVAIRSLPGIRSGSLVAGQQLNCLLSDLGSEHKLFFGALDDASVVEQTCDFARACAIKRRLYGAKMAVVGRRTEGMTPTAVDEVEILRLFGVRLLNLGLDELDEFAAQVDPDAAEQIWQRISGGARQVQSRREDGLLSARYYLALKRLATEWGLSAISIGSYPKCQGRLCLPIALLNQEGLPTGCEGDVNSTLAMLILSMLSDQPPHFGEMLDVDRAENWLISSHCGCGSPVLAGDEGYILCPVRLANDGVCVRFAARPGEVTFVNLVGRKGNYRLCAFEGKAVPTGLVFEGNPLKAVLKVPFEAVWRETERYGFGHHWMAAYTSAVPILKEYCRLAGVMGVFPQ